jgi:hypothetical protein
LVCERELAETQGSDAILDKTSEAEGERSRVEMPLNRPPSTKRAEGAFWLGVRDDFRQLARPERGVGQRPSMVSRSNAMKVSD